MRSRFDNSTLSAEQVAESVAAVTERLGGTIPDIGIIAGSGLSFGDLDILVRVSYADIPHLPEPGVPGHPGGLIFTGLGGKKVLIARGRLHRYEGYSWDQVTLPVRILSALGCERLILTAAVGAVNPDFSPGEIVVIEDHINLMGDNPLAGFAEPELGDRFVNLHSVYDDALTKLALEKAASLNLSYRGGVYAAVLGPSYETPAEVRMIEKLGGDVVGMSVVPEAIVAAQCGLYVLGLCVVSNRASEPGGHDEVVMQAKAAEKNVVKLINAVVKDMGK